jgi:hypothetical protein
VALDKIAREGRLDLEEFTRKIPALLEAGVTQFEFHPFVWMDGPDEFRGFMRQLAALKKRFS